MSLTTKISRKIEWDMGHRLQNHESLCSNPHGHRYVAEIVIGGPVHDNPVMPDFGMVQDFGSLKEVLNSRIVKPLDHAFMVEASDPFAGQLAQFSSHIQKDIKIREVQFPPTAENIAAWIFDRLDKKPWPVLEVTVWETPNCKATVTA